MFHLVFFLTLAGNMDNSIRFSLETADFSLYPAISHVKVGHLGWIYIADPAQQTIRVFSMEGRYLFNMGRKGEGPGEFKRWFGQFSINGKGDIYQLDNWAGNRWVNIFGPRGKFLKIIPLREIPGVFGGRNVYHAPNDKLIIGIEHEWRTGKLGPLFTGGSDVSFYQMNADASLGQEIIKTHFVMEISEFPDREGRPFPNAPDIIVAFSQARNLLAWQATDNETIRIVDLQTMKHTQVANGFKKRPMVKESIQAFVEERFATITPANFRAYEERLYGKMIDMASKLDMFLPIVHRLFFSQDGELYMVSGEEFSKSFKVHVLSPDNKIVRTFTTDAVPVATMKHIAYYLEKNQKEGTASMLLKKRPKNF